MTTVLLWQIRQSSKKVSLLLVCGSSESLVEKEPLQFSVNLTREKKEKKKKKEKTLLENAAWGTCAFVQPNKDAVITGKGWKFTVRAVFFFFFPFFFFFTLALILGIVITVTSIVACQCASTAEEESCICTCTAYTGNPRSHEMHLSKLDVIHCLFCWGGEGAWMGAQWERADPFHKKKRRKTYNQKKKKQQKNDRVLTRHVKLSNLAALAVDC